MRGTRAANDAVLRSTNGREQGLSPCCARRPCPTPPPRPPCSHTRAIVDAIHSKELETGEYETMPIFNLQVPKAVTGVPAEVLMPSNMWADKEGYTRSLRHLADLFSKNFETFAVSGCLRWR